MKNQKRKQLTGTVKKFPSLLIVKSTLKKKLKIANADSAGQ